MFIVVCKLPPKKIRYLLAAGILALVVTAVLFHRGSIAASGTVDDGNISRCLDCLHSYGWAVDATPIETETFLLSQHVSDGYLALQQEAGFDFGAALGKKVTRYTFTVTNYPTGESGVLADVFLYVGEVVGGDIRTSDRNGFMHSLLWPD